MCYALFSYNFVALSCQNSCVHFTSNECNKELSWVELSWVELSCDALPRRSSFTLLDCCSGMSRPWESPPGCPTVVLDSPGHTPLHNQCTAAGITSGTAWYLNVPRLQFPGCRIPWSQLFSPPAPCCDLLLAFWPKVVTACTLILTRGCSKHTFLRLLAFFSLHVTPWDLRLVLQRLCFLTSLPCATSSLSLIVAGARATTKLCPAFFDQLNHSKDDQCSL